MKKTTVGIFILILLHTGLLASKILSPAALTQLDQILAKTGEYCDLLKNMAFDFVCKENVKETINIFNRKKVLKRTDSSLELMDVTELNLRRAQNDSLLYDYQMIKKGEKIEEKRILLEENKA